MLTIILKAGIFLLLVFFGKFSFKSIFPLNVIAALLATFGFGYYILPFLFPASSGFAKIDETKIDLVLGIHFLFLLGFAMGLLRSASLLSRAKVGIFMPALDSLFERKAPTVLVCALVLYFVISGFDYRTWYDFSGDPLEFVNRERSFLARLSVLLPFLLGAATQSAYLIGRRSKLWLSISLFPIFLVSMSLLSGAQRLLAITPLLYIFIYGCEKFGFRRSLVVLFSIVGFLLVFSPLAVFLRETYADKRESDYESALNEFSEKNKFSLEQSLISISERADLYYVTSLLAPRESGHKFDEVKYLSSVFFAYLPRLIRPENTYPLSDDGTLYGETSVKVWCEKYSSRRSVGSLSAFAGLYAYREGGLFWAWINGFLASLVGSVLIATLGASGTVARNFLGGGIVILSVKYVPASFFQLLVDIAMPAWILVLLVITEKLLIKPKEPIYHIYDGGGHSKSG